MYLDALGQGFYVVAALQTADQPAPGVRLRHLQHPPRQRREILRLQAERTDRDLGVRVEAGAEKHQLRRATARCRRGRGEGFSRRRFPVAEASCPCEIT